MTMKDMKFMIHLSLTPLSLPLPSFSLSLSYIPRYDGNNYANHNQNLPYNLSLYRMNARQTERYTDTLPLLVGFCTL